MSIFLPRQPQAHLPFLYPHFQCLSLVVNTTRRHESTARRSTKRLRTKTDPTFTSSIAPSNRISHVVLNPPSSSPSPYHTPPAFLPPSDPRRVLLAQSYAYANPYNEPSRRLPPPLDHEAATKAKKYHLTPDDIAEIRRLRQEDPYTWTRKALAEKYDCSQFFVGMVGPLTSSVGEKKKQEEISKSEQAKQRWGRRKRWAREERSRRRETWGRDE